MLWPILLNLGVISAARQFEVHHQAWYDWINMYPFYSLHGDPYEIDSILAALSVFIILFKKKFDSVLGYYYLI